jgi:hypothetical protein
MSEWKRRFTGQPQNATKIARRSEKARIQILFREFCHFLTISRCVILNVTSGVPIAGTAYTRNEQAKTGFAWAVFSEDGTGPSMGGNKEISAT